ncbi:Glutaredoxin [endosymbiont of Ridgeia piscesae]|jgi:glutaredoxin|uniref:Glutaredoxin n=2 Tax=endosymbiont of Ridgeia piscesae TaxID=54398 RepID=A0A0T5Z3Z7_9GAMM|nr:Glutaredoxin [endosymbiont of Ridgeia piscesae]KRT57604.1 Glutaredoxin [endosymbiont of Ridgeia piscesae]
MLGRLFGMKALNRSTDEQTRIDQACRSLALYQTNSCPYCVTVRRTIKKLQLKIELRDIQRNPAWRQELMQGGGMTQVPCLRIEAANGRVQWMYESADIKRYLRQHFSS